jgi:hypothetical protein
VRGVEPSEGLGAGHSLALSNRHAPDDVVTGLLFVEP